MYERILLPLDGSELAEQAIPEAERLARLTGAPIHLIRVVDVTQLPWYSAYGLAMEYSAVEVAMSDEGKVAASYLKQVADRLTADGLTVETEILRGPAARALVYASREGDVIVMASHGRGGVARWILGSVAEDLLRHAAVPILLIKPSGTEAAKEPAAPAEAVAAAGSQSGRP